MRRNNFHSHELKRIASALEKLVEMLEKGKKRRQLRKRRVNAPSIPVRNEATDSGKVNNGVSGQVKRRANLSFEDLIRRNKGGETSMSNMSKYKGSGIFEGL